ncbi:molybdopterin dinucleotide binding domain-containing protein [Thermodesulfobacteriota bacterium]
MLHKTSSLAVHNQEDKGDKIPFLPFSQAEREIEDMEYPFTAMMGSTRYHLGNGTRTSSSERINSLKLDNIVKVPVEDSIRLGIDEDDSVRISSSYGNIERKVMLTKGLRSGTIFIPKALDENNALNLFALATPGAEDSPGLKDVRVKIEKIYSHIS